ncbi:MAG: hypothetical protein UV59_C0002G0006 [Candidatus Gottesmanbacteria bacterium GW2011_GWA1_43_11]|uniref:Uncharacterized protein n=1 Tax=Candidatus Gottesmanbacteria bacterium GW2011_GWA1_43_11 TaxID=1618436 RepID=A0A0G1ESS9_9BACT|nr:MAG: hypothetical protein UV59_C0002G0006 [Candidatus Gottesmanbacteria bacterium GW2011_GWA1_43_11]
MKTLAAYPGKIEIDRNIPEVDQSLFSQPFMRPGVVEPGSSSLDILSQNLTWDVRNDFIFIPIFLAVILTFAALALFKIKVFGKTLTEYLQPIWYFVLIAAAVVLWQYIVGVTLEGDSIQLRISQIIWELMVGISVYLLSKKGFGYGNIFFVGVLYSIFIHGLKVSIRYFFYAKTLWYVLDRFLYGSLLVMLVAVGLGFIFILSRNKKLN